MTGSFMGRGNQFIQYIQRLILQRDIGWELKVCNVMVCP